MDEENMTCETCRSYNRDQWHWQICGNPYSGLYGTECDPDDTCDVYEEKEGA